MEKVKIKSRRRKIKDDADRHFFCDGKRVLINRLVSKNFRSIYDKKDKNVFELLELDGIGEKSAYAIYHALSKISVSVYEQENPRINPELVR